MPVKTNNICKFIVPEEQQPLRVSCFVLEGDPAVMAIPDTLKSHKMILVTKGCGRFRMSSDDITFAPGDLVFGFCGEIFRVEADGACEYLYLHFEGSRADELLRRFDISKNNRCFSNFDGLIPLWKESLARADVQTVDLASESILLYTFSRLTGVNVRQRQLVNEVLALLEANFHDPEISIRSISKALSYNPKYISHLFKAQMGVGLTEYLRALRIKYAVSLFDHGIDSVKNVALLSGFSDPQYFSTVFKKSVGLSPKDYISQSGKP